MPIPPAKMKILLILAKKVPKNSNKTFLAVLRPTQKPEPAPDTPRPTAAAPEYLRIYTIMAAIYCYLERENYKALKFHENNCWARLLYTRAVIKYRKKLTKQSKEIILNWDKTEKNR